MCVECKCGAKLVPGQRQCFDVNCKAKITNVFYQWSGGLPATAAAGVTQGGGAKAGIKKGLTDAPDELQLDEPQRRRADDREVTEAMAAIAAVPQPQIHTEKAEGHDKRWS